MMLNTFRPILVVVVSVLAFSAAAIAADVDKQLRKGDEALAAGRLQEAEAAYRKGLERSPMHPLLHLDLGIVLAKQGRSEEALSELRMSDFVLPGSWDTSFWLCDVLITLERWSECQATAQRMVEMRPQSLDALDRLGVCAGRAGSHVVAADAMQRAVAIEDLVDRRRILAWEQYSSGDFAGARDTAEHGLEVAPAAAAGSDDSSAAEMNREELKYVLGLSELALGDLEGARLHLGDRPAVGIRVASLPDGLEVLETFRGMPADRAGVRPGDVITHFNGVEIGDGRPDLTDLLSVQPPGAEVRLTVRRGADTTVAVTHLGVADPSPSASVDVAGDARSAESGLRVDSVRVEPASVAAGSSFRIVVEVSARTASPGTGVPVRLGIRILQDGAELTRGELTEQIFAGKPQQIVKEVPRAAGRPGRYTVTVDAESPAGSATGSADFEIVG